MLSSNEANKRGFFLVKNPSLLSGTKGELYQYPLNLFGFFIVGKFEDDEDYLLT